MENQRIALIFGITGQDGSYLTELLLEKNFIVHGMIRKSSSKNTQRLDHLYKDRHEKDVKLFLHYGDVTDYASVSSLLVKIGHIDHLYMLQAQSNVHISFEMPITTAQIDAIGTLNIIDAVKNYDTRIKIYNALTSELYGTKKTRVLNEETAFAPQSIYAVSKLFAYHSARVYKDSYNMFITNGILFNHSSPRRTFNFLEMKVVQGAVAIRNNRQQCLYLGNLNSTRDIGHSKDYVRGMFLMMEQAVPDDYVLATGEEHSVRDICNICFKRVGLPLAWEGAGLDEVAKVKGSERVVIRVDEKYLRKNDVVKLQGDSTKARKRLGWMPEYNLNKLLIEMIDHELQTKYNKFIPRGSQTVETSKPVETSKQVQPIEPKQIETVNGIEPIENVLPQRKKKNKKNMVENV